MLLTNHALTGVWLGTVIDDPLAAFPAGVASHLLLDATPHFWLRWRLIRPRGAPLSTVDEFKHPISFVLGSLDFVSAASVLFIGLVAFPTRRGQIVAAWLGAVAPDLVYLPDLFFGIKFLQRFTTFHGRIQWSESYYGAVTEVIVAAIMLHLLHWL